MVDFGIFVYFGERGASAVSSKVTDIGANRKPICDFLLVRNSNLGPVYLASFRSYGTFYA